MNESLLQFCPRCGKLTAPYQKNLRICITCKHKNYINPRPCNAVIFHNAENQILMIKRKIPPQKNKWDLPGGFINPGETLEKSVEREIQEELSLENINYRYFSSYYDSYTFEGVRYPTLCFIFSAFLKKSEKLTCADDAASYMWHSFEKIPFGAIAFKGIQQALSDFFIR